MRFFFLLIISVFLFSSCSSSKKMVKIEDIPRDTFLLYEDNHEIIFAVIHEFKVNIGDVSFFKTNIEKGDTIQIDHEPTDGFVDTGCTYQIFNDGKGIRKLEYIKNGYREGFAYRFYEKHWTNPHENTVSKITQFKNGNKHGREIELTPRGYLRSEWNYKNGLLDGKVRLYYYGRGRLLSETNFVNGQIHGKDIGYFRSGKKRFIQEYRYGEYIKQENYNRRGQVIKIYHVREEKHEYPRGINLFKKFIWGIR